MHWKKPHSCIFFLLDFLLWHKTAFKTKWLREKGQILCLDLIQCDFLLLKNLSQNNTLSEQHQFQWKNIFQFQERRGRNYRKKGYWMVNHHEIKWKIIFLCLVLLLLLINTTHAGIHFLTSKLSTISFLLLRQATNNVNNMDTKKHHQLVKSDNVCMRWLKLTKEVNFVKETDIRYASQKFSNLQ